MDNKKNVGNGQRSVDSIQVLMDTVQITASCSKNLQKAAKTIVTSCYTHGTRGEAHKRLLLDKANGMRSLAELYGSASSKFESAAMKLVSGIQEDKVWADVLAYGIFFADQLESEKNNSANVLNILQENTT